MRCPLCLHGSLGTPTGAQYQGEKAMSGWFMLFPFKLSAGALPPTCWFCLRLWPIGENNSHHRVECLRRFHAKPFSFAAAIQSIVTLLSHRCLYSSAQ